MKIVLAITSALLFVSACAGASLKFKANQKWDDLRVTWGPNIKTNFKSQPRTVDEAKRLGFKPVGSGKCGASKRYNGIAYALGDDYSLTLLYDVKGYIAGIQVGIIKELAEKEHYPSRKIRPPFVPDGITNDRYVLTAYFTEPSKICTTGRTQKEFRAEGTGTNLWLQTGNFSNNVTLIQKREANVTAPWVQGKCFVTMGRHYWYNISTDMSCDSLFPVFTLYNEGQLNAFGWAMVADLPSPHDEHPGKQVFGLFMKEVPECLKKRKTISTLHIYLTSTPWFDKC